MKRLFSVVLLLGLLLTLGVLPTAAEGNGTVGSLRWSKSGTVLTITGSGDMGQNIGQPWGTAITKVIIGEGVTTIADNAFAGCTALTEVQLPSTLQRIGGSAFSGCTALSQLSAPDGVTRVGANAFDGTLFLANPAYTDGVLYVGKCAVAADTSRPSLALRSGTKFIAYGTFFHCGTLTQLYIPDSVISMEESAFLDCAALKNIYYGGSAEDIHIASNVLPDGVAWHNDACYASQEHTWGDKQTSAPSCTQSGSETRSCTVCGYTETTPLPATGHTFGDWTETKAPTCILPGEKSRICSVCGHTETGIIPATEQHTYGDWSAVKKPTCVAAGGEIRSCSVCNHTEAREIPALGHTHTDWIQTKAPTCTQKGVQQRNCTVCGQVETQSIPSLGHTFGEATVTKLPTCTELGQETSLCTRCGEARTAPLPESGHQFGTWREISAATCTTDGSQSRNCTVCGQIETQTLPVLGHDFENPTIVKPATIYATGLKEGNCRRCKEITTEVIPCSTTDGATGIHFQTTEGVFGVGTTLTVTRLPDADLAAAMNGIASKYTGYRLAAVLEKAAVQPDGTVTVTVPVPAGYSDNLLLCLVNGGVVTKLDTTLSPDGTTASATLASLGDLVLCDMTVEATVIPQPPQPKWPMWLAMGIAVLFTAVGIAAMLLRRKAC